MQEINFKLAHICRNWLFITVKYIRVNILDLNISIFKFEKCNLETYSIFCVKRSVVALQKNNFKNHLFILFLIFINNLFDCQPENKNWDRNLELQILDIELRFSFLNIVHWCNYECKENSFLNKLCEAFIESLSYILMDSLNATFKELWEYLS